MKTQKNILVAFLLNLLFVIIEVVGGFLTNSIAILSDAIHDAGDCIAVGTAYFLEKKSKKKPNGSYTYGYVRYSLISALITSAILLLGSGIVIYSSIERIINPEPIKGTAMLIIAGIGVIINAIAVIKTARKSNINEKAINLHMLEDLLGWIVVLIGSIFIAIFDIYILDPILSILVALYLLYHVIHHFGEIFSVFLEKTPKGFSLDTYKEHLLKLENIKDIHHVHVWTLDGEHMLATLHVVVDQTITKEEMNHIKHLVEEESREFHIDHITIQIDDYVCHDTECNVHALESHHEHHHHYHH